METTASQRGPEKRPDSPPTPIEWLMRPDLLREPPPPPPPKKANLRCLADLPEQPLQWLWPGRIPRGALTLLCGDPGRGKSLLSLDIAARVTTGEPWPDGAEPDQPGDVLLLSGEDSIGRIVRSRLLAHGANLHRVFYLNSGVWLEPNEPLATPIEKHGMIQCSTFGDVPVRFTRACFRDAYQIKPALEALPECRLVVIDPMPAYFQIGSIDAPEQAREYLTPLTAFADRTGAAIIAVVHRDQAMRRTGDRRFHSVRALADLARAVYLVDRHPELPGSNWMLPVKNNLGDAQIAMTFSVASTEGGSARINWDPTPLDLAGQNLAHEAQSHANRPPRLLEIDRAVAWLQGALAAGPVPSQTLIEQAAEAGVSERCLSRARTKLRVAAYNDGKIGGRWMCALPENAMRISRERHNSDLAASAVSAPSAASPLPEVFVPVCPPNQDQAALPEPNSVD
jgi:KaiC/GvpD/RAD55 family RecA-like ATPase